MRGGALMVEAHEVHGSTGIDQTRQDDATSDAVGQGVERRALGSRNPTFLIFHHMPNANSKPCHAIDLKILTPRESHSKAERCRTVEL